MKPLSARQIEFKHRLWEEIGKPNDPSSILMLKEFCDYWFEINYNGRKMRFEKEKTFCFKRRWNTWKKKTIEWNTPKEKRQTLPNFFNKSLWQKLDPEKMREYKLKLQGLGWVYSESPNGNHWLSPTKERIWL